MLADRLHLVAPDLPGFGLSELRDHAEFTDTFDDLADVMERVFDTLGLQRYALYVFDYGAPVGCRLAMAHPERVSAIVSQNGNAYEEGLSDGWGSLRTCWADPTPANRDAIRPQVSDETTRWQYGHGTPAGSRVAPESYTLDAALLQYPGVDELPLDLFLDDRSNVALYPDFHDYFATYQPPLLAVWGRNDPYFRPTGAQAYRRDLPEAAVHLHDTGHVALETHTPEIAATIAEFLQRRAKA